MHFNNISIPIIGAPLFLISNPKLVIEQCKQGVIGSFPALNAREEVGDDIELEKWLKIIVEELDRYNQKHPENPAAPYAVNHIVHRSNIRLERDVDICHKWNVPIWITSLGARKFVNEAAHSCGAITLHDVINNKFAKKAIEKGADGLIAVAAGAGGHAGTLSPFSLMQEIRDWFDGPLILSGSISSGKAILAAQIIGADLAYIGSAFIATKEANAKSAYKEMIVEGTSEDIIYTDCFTGVFGNYLKKSLIKQGLDAENLPKGMMDFNYKIGSSKPNAWKDIWSSGQGIGATKKILSTELLIKKFKSEYLSAKEIIKNNLNNIS